MIEAAADIIAERFDLPFRGWAAVGAADEILQASLVATHETRKRNFLVPHGAPKIGDQIR
jgi:hypothetical protein